MADEIELSDLPTTEFLERVNWTYNVGRLEISVPRVGRSPLEDALHEYLSEVGEPLE